MIYLDYNATAPMRPEVLDAMTRWFGVPANPASIHRAGQRARMAVERARVDVAALCGGDPTGVVFTSGATEANHLFLRGIVRQTGLRKLALSPIEHPCVFAAARASEAEVFLLPVGTDGVVDVTGPLPDGLAAISLMAANHETGVLQPIHVAHHRAKALGVALHVDATQAAGRVPLQLAGVDGVVFSSHKLGGPGGVGALVLRDGEPFPALVAGGSQERNRRAGTVNVAGVVGFGAACRLALAALVSEQERLQQLSERIRSFVVRAGGTLVGTHTLPTTTTAIFSGLRGEILVQALDLRGICVSSGAACASGSVEASPVLTAMRCAEPGGGVRFSIGWATTSADIDALEAALPDVLAAVRELD